MAGGRWWKVTATLLSVTGVGMWGVGLVAFRPAGTASPALPPSTPEASLTTDQELLPSFAVGDRVRLHLPAESLVAVAFHEASYGDAVRLRPLGVCRICRNRWKFSPPPAVDRDLRYIVMDSRGRSHPATSAVDVVMSRNAEIVSPVDGVVRRVKRYRLYGGYRDVRVEIRATGMRRRVVLLHLSHVRLSKGDRVQASVTGIGLPRRLPFESQVDRYVRGRYPHVHLEVKRPAARHRSS
jgi:hypothetical protein